MNTEFCNTDAPIGGIVFSRILRHRRLFALVLTFSLAVTGLIVLVIPPKYQSRMKLLVRSDRQTLVIDPNEGKSSSSVQDLVENRVNSEIALMTSRDVLQQVVLQSDLAHESGTVAAAGPPTQGNLNSAINSLGRQLVIETSKWDRFAGAIARVLRPA